MRLAHFQRRRKHSGFSLIEVLVTIVVTAVGLLTAAGLQAAAKKTNLETAQRTTAVALAQDMVERMRTNPTVWSKYLTSDATTLASDTDCVNASCTNTQRAARDLYVWGQSLLGAEAYDSNGNSTGGLVSPTGCVEQLTSSSGATIYHVAIAWRGSSPVTQLTSTSANYDACGMSTSPDKYADPLSGTASLMRRMIYVEFM